MKRWVTLSISPYDYERGLRLAIPTREKQLTPSSVSVVRRPLTAFGNGGVRSQPRGARSSARLRQTYPGEHWRARETEGDR